MHSRTIRMSRLPLATPTTPISHFALRLQYENDGWNFSYYLWIMPVSQMQADARCVHERFVVCPWHLQNLAPAEGIRIYS